MKCTPQKTIVSASVGRRAPGEAERVADVVGDVLDLGHLVVVGEDHRAALGRERAHLVLQLERSARGVSAPSRRPAAGPSGRFMAAPPVCSERSRAGAECVSAPIEIHSTPVRRDRPRASAGSRRRSPRARRGRPPGRPRRAAAATSMLSSSSRGAPAASACSISRASRTSTSSVPASSGAAWRARSIAGGDPAGGRDVVLLDQDRVVEPGAVVDGAAGGDRRLLQRAQAGRRLARVEHPAPVPSTASARPAPPSWPRPRGEPGSSAPCAPPVSSARALPRHREHRAPCSRQRPSSVRRVQRARASSSAKGQLGRAQAVDHAGRLLGDQRARLRLCGDRRERGHVAAADVLLQCAPRRARRAPPRARPPGRRCCSR